MAFSFAALANPGYYAENRAPAHSDHRWYPTERDWQAGTNPLILPLNGLWRFFCARNEGQVPAGFEYPSFDCRGWASIPVPAHIQMEGYGVPQYVNQQYPWDGWEALEPGEIPTEYNPVACYIKYFQFPENMRGQRVFLTLEGAESCAAVWLNGSYIGFSSNSFSPCSFELTDALRTGENKLALRVYQWSAGSWLEDQDFFRFSGLFRDVYLSALPAVHLWDLRVEPILSGDDREGTLKLSGTLFAGTDWRLAVTLDGQPAGEVRDTAGGSGTASFALEIPVHGPRLWSAEEPNLYETVLRLYDGAGVLREVVPQSVGFRRFAMENGVMCLNGKRIVFCGANRHDFSGTVGRAVTEREIRRDLLTMKRNNINALRTCHYPNSALVYRLCDELGLYVMAENNMETHGVWNLIEAGTKPLDFALPGDRADWEPMLLDRVESTFQTCKNHPSILIWSLGNESFGGSVIAHMADRFRALDSSRLIHYEGVTHDRRYDRTSTDMESEMYPSAASIRAYLAEHRERPFLCCEYSHAMGNSCGGMERYTELAWEDPFYQGGFLWDFIDQSIRGKDRFGNPCWHYGGDLGDRPSDYAFSGNGICLSDGRESAKMPEVKANYQPFAIRVAARRDDSGAVTGVAAAVENRCLFLDAAAYRCRVVTERDGIRVHEAETALRLAPGEKREFPLPVPAFAIPGEYAVTVSLCLREDTPWAARGHEIAFGQGVFPVKGTKPADRVPANGMTADRVPADNTPSGGTSAALSDNETPSAVCSSGWRTGQPLRVVRGWYNTGVLGDGFRVLFSNLDGGLASYQYGGVEYLQSIPLPNFWRPVTDNDLGGQVHLRCAQWKAASQFVSCREPGKGYWNGAYLPRVDMEDGVLTVTYTYRMPTSPASSCTAAYSVEEDGTVRCRLHYEPVPGLPPMPEFGMLFLLDADLDRLTWYGLGPGESYPDRRNGVRLGIWENRVRDNFSDYLRPQESGAHMGVRWAKVTDERGRGLLFRGRDLLFSALPWTPHEIDCAAHPGELPPVCHTVVRAALTQMGVGGDDTWGSVPHPEYWLPTDTPLDLEFSFRGCVRDNPPW